MIVKALEVRDRNTFIPVAAIKMAPSNWAQKYLLGRVGFRDGDAVTVMRLNDQKATADVYGWGAGERTMPNAHAYIEKHFDELQDGDVVDVEFILGESPSPKAPERINPFNDPPPPEAA